MSETIAAAANTPSKQIKSDEQLVFTTTPMTGTTGTDSATPGNNKNDGGEESSDDDDIVRDQDRLMPIANVARIMKQAVPQSAKISKDAKECVQECVSEFISFVSSEYSFYITYFILLLEHVSGVCKKRGKLSTEKI